MLTSIKTSELLCALSCLKQESQDSLGGNSTTQNQHFVQILGCDMKSQDTDMKGEKVSMSKMCTSRNGMIIHMSMLDIYETTA